MRKKPSLSHDLGKWVEELEFVEDELLNLTYTATKARLEFTEQFVKSSYASYGGDVNNFLGQSIGSSVHYSKRNNHSVVGTVGVYNIDSVKASFGKTDKDFNAAQLAYWIEHGTSRLRGGGVKNRKLAKAGAYADEDLINIAPKPFIEKGFLNSVQSQEEEFNKVFNEEYNKRFKP